MIYCFCIRFFFIAQLEQHASLEDLTNHMLGPTSSVLMYRHSILIEGPGNFSVSSSIIRLSYYTSVRHFDNTVEPRYNEVLGTMKITLLYQVSHYIRVKRQRNIKSWDQQNYLVIRGFCYIRPLYNEVPLYYQYFQ